MRPHPWNRHLWGELTAERGRLPHALLLHGPKGVGKRQFAMALAKWLLCESPGIEGACGVCSACNWFEQGNHPDFRMIAPAAEAAEEAGDQAKKGGQYITISEVRQLGELLALASHQGGWRAVIVHPAESMNLAAANALLKTLEEPPKNVLLMLVSHQPRRLLPTVLSRCRKLAIPLPPRDSALAWLGERGLRDAGNLLHEAGGAPLLALEYADGERVQRRQRFIEGLSRPRDPALYELAKEFQGRVPEVWAWLSRWLYDLLAAKSGLAPRYFPDEIDLLRSLSRQTSLVELWGLQQELMQAGRWLRHPLNSQLLLESWLSRYAQLQEPAHG